MGMFKRPLRDVACVTADHFGELLAIPADERLHDAQQARFGQASQAE